MAGHGQLAVERRGCVCRCVHRQISHCELLSRPDRGSGLHRHAATTGSGGPALPSSPEWKLNAGWDYNFDLGSTFEGVFSGSYVWQSEQNFSLNQDPQTVQESYGILNLSAGIHQLEDHYRVTLFVNNVFDKGTRWAAAISSVTSATSSPPRSCRRAISSATVACA